MTSGVPDGAVTRSAEATTPAAVARVAEVRIAQPNGWWAMVLLVAIEATLFGTLLATYYYLRFSTVSWPPAGVKHPDVALPLVLTGVLVATTVPLLVGTRAARRGSVNGARRMLLLAMLVQLGYLAVQVLLFRDDLNSFSPRGSAYGSIYFTLLAVHHAHVVIGILLEVALLARLSHGLSDYRVTAMRAVALYGYFVNAVAILVVLTQVSPSL